jgi:hypothetical protein
VFAIFGHTGYLLSWVFFQDVFEVSGRDRHWTVGLTINLLGYSAVFLPGILVSMSLKLLSMTLGAI